MPKEMTLKVNADLSVAYIPREDEIELLVRDDNLHSIIYRHVLNEAEEHLEIIYKQQVRWLHGMALYTLKYFSYNKGHFDLTAFKELFKACFPDANVSSMNRREAKELCKTFYDFYVCASRTDNQVS